MALVVEVLRVVELQVIAHVDREVLAVEVIVPEAAFRHHEEAQELVRQYHLDFFIESLVVVIGLVWLHLRLLVLLSPVKALRR